MPLVKKQITVAAGATSDQILAGTTYEYVGAGTRLVVAAGADDAGVEMDLRLITQNLRLMPKLVQL